jgi:RNA polymerase sigma-70 factor (ECF subfamily)
MKSHDKARELIEFGRTEQVLDAARLEQNRRRVLARAAAAGALAATTAAVSTGAANLAKAGSGAATAGVASKSAGLLTAGKLIAGAALASSSIYGGYVLLDIGAEPPEAVQVASTPSAAPTHVEPSAVGVEPAVSQPISSTLPALPSASSTHGASVANDMGRQVRAAETAGVGGAVANRQALLQASAGQPRSGLLQQIEVLRQARAALAAGSAARALQLLDSTPDAERGALDQEWTAARVLVLCRLGRESEAKALGARFLERHASSPLAAQVSASCASHPAE